MAHAPSPEQPDYIPDAWFEDGLAEAVKKETAGEQQNHLPAETPSEGQISPGGADPPAPAPQFPQTPNAATGGDLPAESSEDRTREVRLPESQSKSDTLPEG